MILYFVDIGVIVDHHCLNFLFICVIFFFQFRQTQFLSSSFFN